MVSLISTRAPQRERTRRAHATCPAPLFRVLRLGVFLLGLLTLSPRAAGAETPETAPERPAPAETRSGEPMTLASEEVPTRTALLLGLGAPFPQDALPPSAHAPDADAPDAFSSDLPAPDGPAAEGFAERARALPVRPGSSPRTEPLRAALRAIEELLYEGDFEAADEALEAEVIVLLGEPSLLAGDPELADLAFELALAWVSVALSDTLAADRLAKVARLFPAGAGRGNHPPSLLAALDGARQVSAAFLVEAEPSCTLVVNGLQVGSRSALPPEGAWVAARCDAHLGPAFMLQREARLGPALRIDERRALRSSGDLALYIDAAASPALQALRDGERAPALPAALRAGHRRLRVAAILDGERLALHDEGDRLCASRSAHHPWATLWEHAARCEPLPPPSPPTTSLAEVIVSTSAPSARPLPAARWGLLAATLAISGAATWASFDYLSLRSDWAACADQLGCGDTLRFDAYRDTTRSRRRQAALLGATGVALGVSTTLVWRSTRESASADPATADPAARRAPRLQLSASGPWPGPDPPSGRRSLHSPR